MLQFAQYSIYVIGEAPWLQTYCNTICELYTVCKLTPSLSACNTGTSSPELLEASLLEASEARCTQSWLAHAVCQCPLPGSPRRGPFFLANGEMVPEDGRIDSSMRPYSGLCLWHISGTEFHSSHLCVLRSPSVTGKEMLILNVRGCHSSEPGDVRCMWGFRSRASRLNINHCLLATISSAACAAAVAATAGAGAGVAAGAGAGVGAGAGAGVGAGVGVAAGAGAGAGAAGAGTDAGAGAVAGAAAGAAAWLLYSSMSLEGMADRLMSTMRPPSR